MEKRCQLSPKNHPKGQRKGPPSPVSKSKPSSSSSAAPASKEPTFTIYFFHNDSSIKFVFANPCAGVLLPAPPTQRKPLAAKREAFSKLVLRN